jgi:D-beta-D-heptose 7-phosphate kinase/D-beta-D-heptose 1-phosphate adenosyltransferase
VTGLALSLAVGAQAAAAAEIASAVASIVVEKEGQSLCCMDELKAYLGNDQKFVEDWQALSSRLDALRGQGKKIVFTNGVFDILHSAHVAYLNQAKTFGDILVVGVNSDESVKKLKGESRPINHVLERCRVLAGLSCVDFVVPFGDLNPIALIHYVKPDIYVKGGDYTRETLPEAEVVESYGGELRLVEYIANHSTTGVIERIRKMTVPKQSE